MIDTATLLPPNATSAERAMEMVMRVRDGVHAGADAITSLKDEPPEAFLLWLVWEYGLEELLPYLPNARDVITEGIDWQRIKGTPESLRVALSWLNYGAPAIEEETPIGQHWHEFMVDPGGVPARFEDLRGITRLAALSAPVGTILSRIYHGHDMRRFMLDGSPFGDLLSDHSGVRDDELNVILSFGRKSDTAISLDDTAELQAAVLGRTHSTNHKYNDRPILDFSQFGDAATPNHPFSHAHLFQVAGEGVQIDQCVAEESVQPKAGMVLSDGFVLGDTNSTLYAIEYHELGAPDPLSGGLALSGQPWNIEKRPIDERIDRGTDSDGIYPFTSTAIAGTDVLRTSFAINPVTYEGQAVAVIDVERTSNVQVTGQFWTNLPWVSQPWDEFKYFVRTTHYGDSA